MPIRRLRLDDDDDEDEDEDEDEQQQQEEDAVQPQPQTRTHQTPNFSNFLISEPVIISDDDFVDVPEDISPPSPHPPPPAVTEPQASGCPISDFLRRLGLGLKRDWLAACLRELQDTVRGFQGFDVATKAKLCFEQFLFADLNFCGSGVLPPNVDSMHLAVLPGPYVLQVDEIINISSPLRGRYQQAPPGLKRCLKLSMTDGIQRVFGMEYRPIQALEVCASSGLKVAISNVHVRHGLLMLVPETIQILGGLVEQLDAARKRLVDELNKPPRGIRTKNGVIPPLATRATLAAWPSGRVGDPGHDGSTLHRTGSVLANNQGAGLSISGTGNSSTTEDTLPMGAQNAASNSIPHMVPNAETLNIDMQRSTNPVSRDSSMANQFSSNREEIPMNTANITRENSAGNQSSQMHSNVAVAHRDNVHVTQESSVATRCSPVSVNVETDRDRIPVITYNASLRGVPMNNDMQSGTNPVSHDCSMANQYSSNPEEMHIDTARITRENSVGNQSFQMYSNVAVAHKDTVHVTRDSSVATRGSPVSENVETDRDRVPLVTDNAPLRGSSSTVSDNDDILMVDASDHPLLLSGDREVPFTYLASLSAKWAAMKEKVPLVRGKIKCFLTGVKGFQYKKRTTYELQAYVDDGSLISEILIAHEVVQKGIGYSPEEVTAALSSSDTKIVQNMKETMRKFQAFLANFEGVILVELNRKSSLPLALDMNQGCPQSDAWLLLRRLKSLHPAPVHSDPIVLSP